jgi:outer membrane protein OmpA-like peptidoglycan-associated protein
VIAILLVAWLRNRQLGLSRQLAIDNQGQYLDFQPTTERPFPADQLRSAMRLLGRHRRVGSSRIDVTATVRATASAGGRIRLRFGQRPVLPRYVLVVERTTSFDHLGVLGDLVAERFKANDIRIARYEFDQDMRILRLTGSTRFERLPDVASRHAGERLIMISDGATLFEPNEPSPVWLPPVVASFAGAILMTPAPRAVWGQREAELMAAGFYVVPATLEGMNLAAAAFRRSDEAPGAAVPRPHPGGFNDFVGRLQQEWVRWVADRAPDTEEQRDLVIGLRAWLGKDGFLLLAAFAMFPEVRGEMTFAVAEALGQTTSPSVADGAAFAEVMRLPWLRQGRIPDWARMAFLQALPPASAARVRAVYDAILGRARLSHEARGSRLARPARVLQTWRTVIGNRGITPRERIVWSFWRGLELELAIPRLLAQRLRQRLDRSEWTTLASGAALAGAIALYIGLHPPQRTIEPPPSVPAPVAAPAPPPVPAPPPPEPARSYLVFFDPDSSVITSPGQQIISEAAQNAQHLAYSRINVYGFDDNVSTPANSAALSTRRAQAVADLLVKGGIPLDKISVLGYGQARQLVPTGPNTEEPQNRRVEIIIQPQESAGATTSAPEVSAPEVPAPVAAPAPAPPHSASVFFDFGNADLNDRSRVVIAEMAQTAKDLLASGKASQVVVNGYSDTSGSPQSAMGISIQRANAVAAELVRNGVPSNVISIHGFGETHLLVPTGPGVREPQNRRVEIIIREAGGTAPMPSAPGTAPPAVPNAKQQILAPTPAPPRASFRRKPT